MRQHGKKAYTAFIDFKKAFDSVNHELFFKILEFKGIPTNLITIIKKIYSNNKIKVLTKTGVTQEILVNKGVIQGDPSKPPILFNIYLDYVLNRLVRKKSKWKGITLKKLNKPLFTSDTKNKKNKKKTTKKKR